MNPVAAFMRSAAAATNVSPNSQGRWRVHIAWAIVSQRMPVIRAVGRVRIDDHGRIPCPQTLDQPTNFGRLQLDEVPVEIKPAGVLAVADAFLRAGLFWPLALGDALVAVGVEDQRHKNDEIF